MDILHAAFHSDHTRMSLPNFQIFYMQINISNQLDHCAHSYKHTVVLKTQWYRNSKIKQFYHRHTAKLCSRLIGSLFFSLFCNAFFEDTLFWKITKLSLCACITRHICLGKVLNFMHFFFKHFINDDCVEENLSLVSWWSQAEVQHCLLCVWFFLSCDLFWVNGGIRGQSRSWYWYWYIIDIGSVTFSRIKSEQIWTQREIR